jgi:hypothetical protein
MGESEQAPWRFSPLAVVAESVAFVIGNFQAIVRWSLAPLTYGLGFSLFLPGIPAGSEGGGGVPGFLPALFLLAVILLWIRAPLELRLCRKVLLNVRPGQFYGLELLEKRTWAYLWAYVRVICLFVTACGPALVIATMLAAPLARTGLVSSLPEAARSAVPMLGVFLLLALLLYALLAPRVVLVFPDVAVNGPGRLFNQGPLGELSRRARWRIVAVMALIWAPAHTLSALSYLGDAGGWWKSLTGSWEFVLASYLLGFVTMVLSTVAGAVMYRLLRRRLPPGAIPDEGRTPKP